MPTQQTVIPFSPAASPGNADQLDQAGQTILQLLNKAAGVAEEAETRSRWRRRFRISCAQPRVGLRS
jgi:hypothetical protein